MKKQLMEKLEARMKQLIGSEKTNEAKLINKQKLNAQRNAEIVKVMANGKVKLQEQEQEFVHLYYDIHLKYVVKQYEKLYIEEEIEKRKASFYKGSLYEDREVLATFSDEQKFDFKNNNEETSERIHFSYDRLAAVRYAERWWNEFNPVYKKFDSDCTNYISQCLKAGGAPMRGYPNRSKGWWYQNNNWSFSWTVANALKAYLQQATIGLRAVEIKDPKKLLLGDVICYDFQGDGRYDHNTIVTGKDGDGMPLVNAHTYNSRMRYWSYEDSSAYTPNIKYKMFSIIDDHQ